jgi:hypothetical protein
VLLTCLPPARCNGVVFQEAQGLHLSPLDAVSSRWVAGGEKWSHFEVLWTNKLTRARAGSGACDFVIILYVVFVATNLAFLLPHVMAGLSISFRCLIWADADSIAGYVSVCYINRLLCVGLNKRNSRSFNCNPHINVWVDLQTRFVVPKRPREHQAELFVFRLLNGVTVRFLLVH